MLRSLYARLRAAWPVNRVVTVLTPLAFAPAAGYVAAFVAENFPGVDVSEGGLTAIFIAGAAVALTTAYKWLDGWARYESSQDAQLFHEREVARQKGRREPKPAEVTEYVPPPGIEVVVHANQMDSQTADQIERLKAAAARLSEQIR